MNRETWLELAVTEDPKTKVVSAKAIKQPEKIHLNVNRVIVENQIVNASTKEDIKNSTEEKHNEVTGGFNLNYLWWL